MPHPSDSDLRPSDPLFGTNYRPGRVLGRGGCATVYEAVHVTLGKVVAVKVLDAGLANQERWNERIRVEAQALGQLRSPHVVDVSDFGHTADGRPFVVMERLWGTTLAAELRRRGHFTPVEAIGLVQQLLRGVDAAHRAGLVHRDLKLDNLFLSEEPDGGRQLKILDFGIAKVLPRAAVQPSALCTQEGDVIGTPRFLAPEQAMGRAVDTRADLYGAGVVLYELLTGRDPFHYVNLASALLLAHAQEAPCAPSAIAQQPIDPAIDDVVLRALAKRPEDRYATAGEFAAALTHAIELCRRPPPERGARTARGASLPLAAFMVLAGAALAAVAALLLAQRP